MTKPFITPKVRSWWLCAIAAAFFLMPAAVSVRADAPEVDEALTALMTEQGAAFDFFTVSNLWILLAAGLVFIMHLGFATLESGLCQSKK